MPAAQVTTPEAISPGERLRLAREARGESRAEVAQVLKLSLRQVEALERGQYDALPGPAFVRGFTRNYARHLGLDVDALIATLDASTVAPTLDLAPVSNADGDMPIGSGQRNASGVAGTVVVVLLVAVLAGWYFDWFRTEPSGIQEELGQVEGEVPQGDVAVEVLPPAATVAPSGENEPADAGGAAVVPPLPPSDASSVLAAVPAVPPAPAAPASPAPASPATPAATAEGTAALVPAATEVAGPHLTFRFTGESWVEVKDASGTVIYSGTGAAGSSRNVQGRPPFALVVGNAKDVRLEFNGREIDLQPHTRVAVARLTVQ